MLKMFTMMLENNRSFFFLHENNKKSATSNFMPMRHHVNICPPRARKYRANK